jgi:hypothetical protein
MRVLVSMTIVLLTMALPAASWSAPPAQPPEPLQRPPVSGNLADDVAVQEQGCGEAEPCEGEAEPGLLASVFGRFLNPCECGPHWYFTADAVALQRTSTRNQPLFYNIGTAAPPVLLDAHDLQFPTQLGFQVDAVRRGPCGWEWELGYFQIDGFEANSFVPGLSTMAISSHEGRNVIDGEANYKSAIHLAEINLRRQCGCDGLTLLVGFRAGELNELYRAGGREPDENFSSSVNVNTYNHLYGFQTGAIYEFYNMGGPLRVSAMCKAGIYDNSSIQSSRIITPGIIDDTVAFHRNQAAFIGEAGAVATYQVTCHLSFRASCQAMWIEGVALAPEQIGAYDLDPLTPGIDTHGGIFYYGGGLGIELKF